MGLEWGVNAVLIVVAYLLGSIPTGYWTGRLLKGIDIREHGSGSTGATNVLRVVGKGPGAFVLAVDITKGALAVLLVRWIYTANPFPTWIPTGTNLDFWLGWIAVLAGLGALLGHSCSIWLNFTGGKSVATGLGILLALSWSVALSALAVFGVVLGLSRIVSLSSISAAIAVSLLMILFQQPLPYQLFALAGGVYVVWRHRSNIQRLLAGTEPRLGEKKPTPETESV